MTRLNTHEEQLEDPGFNAAASWTVADSAGSADAETTTASKLTLDAFTGTITATMERAVVAGGLYSFEGYVDSLTLGSSTLTITCGGVTVASVTAAGVYTKEFYATTTAALVITAAVDTCIAVMDRCTLVKHGMGKGV